MAKKRKNKYEKLEPDELFEGFRRMYEHWEQTEEVDPELQPYAEQMNLSYLCLNNKQKSWLVNTVPELLDQTQESYWDAHRSRLGVQS